MKLSKSDIHSKHPLPTDEYLFTITQAYLHERVEDPLLVLCHTVDTGDYAYQHVLERFNLATNAGRGRLKKFSDGIEFTWFVDEVYDPLFTEQFIALRTKARVEQIHDPRRKIIYNKIIEWFVAEDDAEYNVLKERDLSVFEESKRKGKPGLPI